MQLPTTGAPSRRQLRLTLIAWCLAALAVLSAPQAEAAKRLALVMGNDAYEEVEPLERAVADARSYRDALQEQRGFQVFYGENTGRRDMNRLVVDFLSAIGPGDTAMVVYSGHGVQLDPERRDSLYFLPVDFPNRDPGRGAESYFFDSEALNFARLAERRAAAAPAARERALRERAAGARETASDMTSGDYTSHDGADAASPATTEDTIRTPAGTSVTTSSGSSLRTGRRESEDGEAPDWICRANPELNRCRHAF